MTSPRLEHTNGHYVMSSHRTQWISDVYFMGLGIHERDLNPRSVELAGNKPTTTPHPKRDRPPYLYLSLVSKSGLFSGRNSLRPNSGVAAASVPEELSEFGLSWKKIIFDFWPKMFRALNFFITFKVSWSGKVVKHVSLASWHLSLSFFFLKDGPFLASFFIFVFSISMYNW